MEKGNLAGLFDLSLWWTEVPPLSTVVQTMCETLIITGSLTRWKKQQKPDLYIVYYMENVYYTGY